MLTWLWAMQLVTAKGLTIRVINNVSKRMEVKPRFHEAFQKEGCPDAFPYRQKVPTSRLTVPCRTAGARYLFIARILSICRMAPSLARQCSQGQALEPLGQSCCPTGHVRVHVSHFNSGIAVRQCGCFSPAVYVCNLTVPSMPNLAHRTRHNLPPALCNITVNFFVHCSCHCQQLVYLQA